MFCEREEVPVLNINQQNHKSTQKIIEEEILEAIQGHIKILEDRIAQENIEVIIGIKITAEREGAVILDLEIGHFQEIIVVITEKTIEVQE